MYLKYDTTKKDTNPVCIFPQVATNKFMITESTDMSHGIDMLLMGMYRKLTERTAKDW